MFPVPENAYFLKNPNAEKNQQYRTLLNNEIRIIKQRVFIKVKYFRYLNKKNSRR